MGPKDIFLIKHAPMRTSHREIVLIHDAGFRCLEGDITFEHEMNGWVAAMWYESPTIEHKFIARSIIFV